MTQPATTPVQASINILTIDGIVITRDIAKQLDELRFEHRDIFEPHGRIRSGIDYGNSGIELLGRDTTTGALVRMWHVTKPLWAPRLEANKWLPPRGDGLQDTRDALTASYNTLPLIILPKDGRP